MTLKTSDYFPIQFKYVAIFLLIASIPLIIEGGLRLVGGLLLLVSVTVLSVRYEFEIDKEKMIYREYIRLLWMKLGKPVHYEDVDYCYIAASKFTQKMQLRAVNSTLSGVEYNGYLKFSNEEKVHLVVGKKKEIVEAKVKKVADYLGVQVVDHSIE